MSGPKLTPNTILRTRGGDLFTVESIAKMGRFTVSQAVETVEAMLRAGVLLWNQHGELASLPRTADGETVH